MLNGIEIEALQMNDLSMVCVDEHATPKNVTDQTVVGKNLFASGHLRPGTHSFVSPLSLRYSLQDQYRVRTERGHYSVSPTTFVVLNEGLRGEIIVDPNAAPHAVTLVFEQKYMSDIARSFSAPLTSSLDMDSDGIVVRFLNAFSTTPLLKLVPSFALSALPACVAIAQRALLTSSALSPNA